MSSQPIFCDYCGEDITSQKCIQNNKLYHNICLREIEKCKEVIKLFCGLYSTNGHVLSMAIHVNYLYGLKEDLGKDKHKKTKRDKKLEELSSLVSALRNSKSGHILIHLVGLAEKDTYTGPFDEFADPMLYELILDGKLFTHVYKKTRLSEFVQKDKRIGTNLPPGLGEFIVLYVDGASYLTTTKFYSKVSLDDRIIDSNGITLYRFLAENAKFEESFPSQPLCLDDILSQHESRSVQLKRYFPCEEGKETVVDSLIRNRLLEYISAFAKCEDGGSYFLGVTESTKVFEGKNYQSKILLPKPVPITDCDITAKDIKERVSGTVLVCDYHGKSLTRPDLVQVHFVPVNWSDKGNHYIVCVLVRSVSGIVFYNKLGPLAYKLGSDTDNRTGALHITQFSVEEWFKLFMDRHPSNQKVEKSKSQ